MFRKTKLASSLSVLFVTVGLTLFSGCAPQVRSLTSLPHSDWGSEVKRGPLWIKADSLWALRASPFEAKEALKTYGMAIEKQPLPVLMTRYARASFFVGAYIEQDPVQAEGDFRTGAAAAREALEEYPLYAHVMRETQDETEAIETVEGPFLEAIYWSAANSGRVLMSRDSYVRKGAESRFRAMVKQLLVQEDGLLYAGPHRLAAMIPLRVPGGSFDEAKSHFETALKKEPRYAANATLYAEYYATATGNRELFVKLLEDVLKIPDNILPDVEPENHFEKNHAAFLLQSVDALFPLKATAVSE